MQRVLLFLSTLAMALPALAEERPIVHEGLPGDRAAEVRVNRGPEVTPEPTPVIASTDSAPVIVDNWWHRDRIRPAQRSTFRLRTYDPYYYPVYRSRPKARLRLSYKDGDLSGSFAFGPTYLHKPHKHAPYKHRAELQPQRPAHGIFVPPSSR